MNHGQMSIWLQNYKKKSVCNHIKTNFLYTSATIKAKVISYEKKKAHLLIINLYFFVPLHSICKKMIRVEDQPSLTMLLYVAFRYITHVYKKS